MRPTRGVPRLTRCWPAAALAGAPIWPPTTSSRRCAKALGATGVAVKLQWTCEDDIQGGRYRPIYVHRLEAALDNDGRLVGWRHRIVGQSIMAGTAFAAARIKNGIDRTSVEGAANLPYAVPNNRRAGSVVARRGQFTYRLRDRRLTRSRTPPARTRSASGKGCSSIIRATRRCWSSRRKRPAGATRRHCVLTDFDLDRPQPQPSAPPRFANAFPCRCNRHSPRL